jgi:multidrug efflux pump subunit AcrA (membrane-fusion protein)
MRFRLLALALAVAVMASPAAPAAIPEKLMTVVVRKAQKTEVGQTLSYPATVEPKIRATILAESDGVVRKIHAQLGQPVKGGGRLFTVQQTDPIFQYAPVGTISPVGGVVSELLITEGALVTKGQKLAVVTDPKDLKVLVEVPARDMSLLTKGLVGRLESPALAQPLELRLAGVSPSVDPATGTAAAELIPSPKESLFLRPGIIGKITFKADVHSGFLVPEDAVLQSQDKNFIRLVVDQKIKKVPVTLGARLRGQIEITSGLEEGYAVVERSSGFVAEGETVKVEEATQQEKSL